MNERVLQFFNFPGENSYSVQFNLKKDSNSYKKLKVLRRQSRAHLLTEGRYSASTVPSKLGYKRFITRLQKIFTEKFGKEKGEEESNRGITGCFGRKRIPAPDVALETNTKYARGFSCASLVY